MRGGWWHNKWRETVKCLMLCIPHWFPWQWPLLNMLLPSLLSGTFPIATRHTATQGFSALKIEVGGISQQRNPCLANITVDWFVEVMLNHSEPHAWWITKHWSVTLYCVFTILRLSKQATMVHCSWQFAGNTDFFFFSPPAPISDSQKQHFNFRLGGAQHVAGAWRVVQFSQKCSAIKYQRALPAAENRQH